MITSLPDEWKSHAEKVLEIDADRNYTYYWAGYAQALKQCAQTLDARMKNEFRNMAR